MKITVKAKNTQVTEPLKEYVDKRFSKLEKYFTGEMQGTVTLVVEKDKHRAEATIPVNRYLLRAEESSNDMYASIDGIVDKLERQIHKYKTRVNRKSKAKSFADLPPAAPVEAAPVADAEEELAKPIKVKRFTVKPMDEEEAILQMELIGHDFFVFLNADTNEVNVVYKRHDNSYGLIEPQFD